MLDKDNVISGLWLLAHWPDGLIITDKEKWIKSCCERAIELLKEQKSAGPKKGFWLHPTFLDCCCSVCGEQPEHEPGESVPLYDYCPYCGAEMEVKWDET